MRSKPVITFALFAYNQERYIEEAIHGAFSQTYSPLEIVLSDDCSPDETFEVMKQMASSYKGPHKIILNRNERNLGLVGHVSKLFNDMSNGEIIVMAAGDDISYPNRVEKIEGIFRNERIMSVSSDFQYIDEKSNLINGKVRNEEGEYNLEKYLKNNFFPILGCTRAYRKKINTFFEPLLAIPNVEDATLTFRGLLLGSLYHETETLVKYRKGIDSLSKDIDISILNNVVKQRRADAIWAKSKKIIDDDTFQKLSKLFQLANKKNEKRKTLEENNSLIFFLKEIYFKKEFVKKDKIMFLKKLIKKKISNG